MRMAPPAPAVGAHLKLSTLRLIASAALVCTAFPAASLDEPASPLVLTSSVVAPVHEEIPVVLLIDMSSGQTLYSREPNRRFVPASVTKVMTAYTAFGLLAQGKLKSDTPVTISKELAELWSGEGSSMFLQAGDVVTIGQLLLGVTTVSANDGAVALSMAAAGTEDAWLKKMNENAAELGMRDTHFGTPNGWPDEGRTYTSAHDLALLAEAMITRYPGLYHQYIGHHGMSYREITQSNHDPITGVVKGADGIKTGFTRQAGYNFLGSAERDGRRLVMVIAGAPTPNIRNTTARSLMNWGFDAFESREILPGSTVVGKARVQNGSSDAVELKTQGPVLASVPNGSQANASLAVRYRGPIEAPIKAGQQVAWLRVTLPGQQPHDVPLVAAEDVEQAGVFRRLVNGIAGLAT